MNGIGGPASLEQEVIESLNQDQFTSENTFRHGFPLKPTAMAFDPLQRIMAIGSRSGAVRLYGRPGTTLFRNKRLALNEMFQRNASKFAIFYV